MDWPIEAMAEVLSARVTKRGTTHYVLRWENHGLGVKLMLDVGTISDSVRVVIDRLSPFRPTFIGSLVLESAAGVEVDAKTREVNIQLVDGSALVVSAAGTVHLYRST